MSANNEETKKISSALKVTAKEFTPSNENTLPSVIPPASYYSPQYIDPNSYTYNYPQQIYNYGAPYPAYGYVPYQQPYYNTPRPYSNPPMTTGHKKPYNNNNYNTNNNTNNNANTSTPNVEVDIKPTNDNEIKENDNSNDLKQVEESKDNNITNNETSSVVLGAEVSRLANESGEMNFFADPEVDSSASPIKSEEVVKIDDIRFDSHVDSELLIVENVVDKPGEQPILEDSKAGNQTKETLVNENSIENKLSTNLEIEVSSHPSLVVPSALSLQSVSESTNSPRAGGRSQRNKSKGKDKESAVNTPMTAASDVLDDWKSSTPVADNYVLLPPLQYIAELARAKDNIRRYDKLRLLALYIKPTGPVKRLRDLYGYKTVLKEKPPRGYEQAKKLEEEEINKLQQSIFSNKTYEPKKELDINSMEGVKKKANLLLNLLTPENFDKLSTQFLELNLIDEEILEKVIDLIVDKAQLEENFCFMYAKLCRLITDNLVVPDFKPINSGDDEEKSTSKAKNNFRDKLLNRVRNEFTVERSKMIEDIRNMDIPEEEKDYRETTAKRRYTGHIRFIGELFSQDMIKSKIILSCIVDLIQTTEEENLVCLSKLLSSVGNRLDAETKAKTRASMTEYFNKIASISKNHPVARVRFMMKDLLELRSNNWQARREELKAVKLSEMRAEASGQLLSVPSSGNLQQGSTKVQDARKLLISNSRTNSSTDLASSSKDEDSWQTITNTKGKKNTIPEQATSFNRGASPRASGPSRGFSNNNLNNSNNNLTKLSTNNGSSKNNRVTSNITRSTSNDSNSPRPSRKPNQSNNNTNNSNSNSDSVRGEVVKENQVVEAVIEDVQLEHDVLSKVKNALNEYLSNELKDEFVLTIQETKAYTGMKYALKVFLDVFIDKKENDQNKLKDLLIYLQSNSLINGPLITDNRLADAFTIFLSGLDDLICDVPKADIHVSNLLAFLTVKQLLTLNFLSSVPHVGVEK